MNKDEVRAFRYESDARVEPVIGRWNKVIEAEVRKFLKDLTQETSFRLLSPTEQRTVLIHARSRIVDLITEMIWPD